MSSRNTFFPVDAVSRQTSSFTTEVPCDDTPVNIITLDFNGTERYSLTPAQKKRDTPANCKPSGIRSTKQSIIFSGHSEGSISPKLIKNFWKRKFLAKHSEERIQILSEAMSYKSFLDSDLNSKGQETFRRYWTKQLRIGTMARILISKTFLTRRCCTDMPSDTFGRPYYIFTRSGFLKAFYQFLHFVVVTIVYVIKTIQQRNCLEKKDFSLSYVGHVMQKYLPENFIF